MKSRRFLPRLVLVLALSLPAVSLAITPFVIRDIRVEGVQRTEAGTVFTYLPVKVGERIDDEKAAQAIKAGEGDAFVAGGVESMTRAPFVFGKPEVAFGRQPPEVFDSTIGWRFTNPRMAALGHTLALGETAEVVAERCAITREEQDRFALESQRRTAVAMAAGKFADEIVAVALKETKGSPKGSAGSFNTDEQPRPDTTLEALAILKPAFKPGANRFTHDKAWRADDPAALAARCTVQRANYGKLRETVRTARSLGLKSISFLAADVSSDAFNRPNGWPQERQEQIALNAEEVNLLEAEIEAMIDEGEGPGFVLETPEKLRRIVDHFRAHLGLVEAVSPRCNAPWVSAVVESDGTIRPCFFHKPVGNLSGHSLSQVLNSPRALQFRTTLNIARNPICRRCVCSLYLEA